ncbi:MAG: hypothetical protein II453_09265 [Alphaproteobacteria bacterium]|nr:hypothetical protein [Alphaproteobacteria bacterium]
MTFQVLYTYIFSEKINPVILTQMLKELGVNQDGIQSIVEYVMYTSWNTNPAILKQMIGENSSATATVGNAVVGVSTVG